MSYTYEGTHILIANGQMVNQAEDLNSALALAEALASESEVGKPDVFVVQATKVKEV